MKIYVITDNQGNIVATVHSNIGSNSDNSVVPIAKPLPASAGHQVHEIELPKELEGLKDAEQLHSRLREHLKKENLR